MEPFPPVAPSRLQPIAPPEFDVFLDLWRVEVRRAYVARRALAKAEAFIAGFEGDPDQDGVDTLLAEIREALAPDVTVEPASQPGWLSTAALFALIPLSLAATAGVIWSHLI